MANKFETLKDYAPLARTGAKMVGDDLKIASTFNRDLDAEFGGKRGMKVNIKIPSVLVARAKSKATAREAIVVDEIVQSHFSVGIDGLIYQAVDLDEFEKEFEVEDFASEILQPQAEAVAAEIEDRAIQTMRGLDDATSGTVKVGKGVDLPEGMGSTVQAPLRNLTYNPAKPENTFVAARKALVDNGLPASGLWAAVGTGVFADLLNAEAIKDASQSGSTAALRDAQVGKVRGFTVIEAPMLDEHEIVFYGRGSFTLVVRAPKVPRGANGGASVSAGGFASRLVYDYDATHQIDRSTLATFASTVALPVFKVDRSGGPGEGKVRALPSALRVADASSLPTGTDEPVVDEG